MLDFDALFKNALPIREMETKRELLAVQMADPFESSCPDKFELRETTKVVEDKVLSATAVPGVFEEKIVARDVKMTAKIIDQDAGHHRGGNIRGRAGDWIIFDGDGFFVVRDKDAMGVPVFAKRYMTL